MANLRYTATTEVTLKKEAAAAASDAGDISAIPEGWSHWRVLPALSDGDLKAIGAPLTCPHDTVWIAVPKHFVDLPDGKKFIHVCPKKVSGLECGTCAHERVLYRSTYDADQKTAKKIRVNNRSIARVLRRRVDAADDGIDPYRVRMLDFSYTMKEVQLARELEKLRMDSGSIDYTNPLTGFDLRIHRVGTGQNNTVYDISFVKEPSLIIPGDPSSKEWGIKAQAILDTIPQDWYTMLNLLSPAEILNGITPGLGDQLPEPPQARRQALPVGRPATIQSKVYEIPPEAEFIPDAEVEEAPPDSDAQPYAD